MALNQLIYPKGGNEPELIGPLTDLDFTKMVPQDATLINKQIYMLLIPLKELQVLYGIETWLRKYIQEVKRSQRSKIDTDYFMERLPPARSADLHS